jgi:uncharacterized membrane protein
VYQASEDAEGDKDHTLANRERIPSSEPKAALVSGDHLADRLVALIGSWPFLLAQAVVLILWVAVNASGYAHSWDNPPFVLLNLCLSVEAAFAAPLILVAERRSTQALQLKLDEIIRAIPSARDEIIAAEKLPAKEIDRLREEACDVDG